MDELLSRLFSSEEEESYMLDCMAHFMVFMAACTLVTLLFENVPYGRYASSKYGFAVNVKFAWFVQELPAFLVPVALLLWTSSSKTSLLPNQLLLAMYLCHYTQRWVTEWKIYGTRFHHHRAWHLKDDQLFSALKLVLTEM